LKALKGDADPIHMEALFSILLRYRKDNVEDVDAGSTEGDAAVREPVDGSSFSKQKRERASTGSARAGWGCPPIARRDMLDLRV